MPEAEGSLRLVFHVMDLQEQDSGNSIELHRARTLLEGETQRAEHLA